MRLLQESGTSRIFLRSYFLVFFVSVVFDCDIAVVVHEFQTARWLIRRIRKAVLASLSLYEIFHFIRHINITKVGLGCDPHLFQIFFCQFQVNIAVRIADGNIAGELRSSFPTQELSRSGSEGP